MDCFLHRYDSSHFFPMNEPSICIRKRRTEEQSSQQPNSRRQRRRVERTLPATNCGVFQNSTSRSQLDGYLSTILNDLTESSLQREATLVALHGCFQSSLSAGTARSWLQDQVTAVSMPMDRFTDMLLAGAIAQFPLNEGQNHNEFSSHYTTYLGLLYELSALVPQPTPPSDSTIRDYYGPASAFNESNSSFDGTQLFGDKLPAVFGAMLHQLVQWMEHHPSEKTNSGHISETLVLIVGNLTMVEDFTVSPLLEQQIQPHWPVIVRSQPATSFICTAVTQSFPCVEEQDAWIWQELVGSTSLASEPQEHILATALTQAFQPKARQDVAWMVESYSESSYIVAHGANTELIVALGHALHQAVVAAGVPLSKDAATYLQTLLWTVVHLKDRNVLPATYLQEEVLIGLLRNMFRNSKSYDGAFVTVTIKAFGQSLASSPSNVLQVIAQLVVAMKETLPYYIWCLVLGQLASGVVFVLDGEQTRERVKFLWKVIPDLFVVLVDQIVCHGRGRHVELLLPTLSMLEALVRCESSSHEWIQTNVPTSFQERLEKICLENCHEQVVTMASNILEDSGLDNDERDLDDANIVDVQGAFLQQPPAGQGRGRGRTQPAWMTT